MGRRLGKATAEAQQPHVLGLEWNVLANGATLASGVPVNVGLERAV